MTKKPTNKMELWANALYNDILNPNCVISLIRLLQRPKNTPCYDENGIPEYWFTDRTAAFYIQKVFGDDHEILNKLGIKPENIQHIFWGAYSEETNLDYYNIWKNGGLNPDGPKPYEEKVEYRYPEKRYGGFSEFFSLDSTVLELGSGKGVALAQFHNGLNHRDRVTWIGIDRRYEDGEISTTKRGKLQFAKDDFHRLLHIPNSSIDKILDVQSAFTHGNIPRVAEQLTRVSKKGAILRAQLSMDYLKDAINNLITKGWDVYTIGEDSLVARLR